MGSVCFQTRLTDTAPDDDESWYVPADINPDAFS